jgi:NAD(P)-dependent dehydrogenase (short-subunit alcohol dehydrogenase family)
LRALPVAAHLGRRPDIDRLFGAIQAEFGRLDILVNNAATNPVFGPLTDMEEEAWAAHARTQGLPPGGAARGQMRAAGRATSGRLDRGLQASPGIALLVSKAAYHAHPRPGQELAPFGVRVARSPGARRDRFMKPGRPEILDAYLKSTPWDGAPSEEMASAHCFRRRQLRHGQTLVRTAAASPAVGARVSRGEGGAGCRAAAEPPA